ncbi:hypothetical protein ACJRO7_007816 [Eucalyptus globulus]|uniref:Myb-like domain-containing protein n=1 Tax=Eucalyptus globulus TaxID=34317 RepID=A0ABD3IPF9_EUCGL
MEMEDHHQYTAADLRHLINARPPPPPPHIQSISPPELFCGGGGHRNPTQHLESMMMGGGGLHNGQRQGDSHNHQHHHQFGRDHSSPSSAAMAGAAGGLESENGGNGRWPRQETLTLLEIRSRLDSRFKEANQKGPLWDEVSRIMSEEHGYQRSGKKCREKFENLYKYYKKTKEGKAGRQDGKHYRFFRQLEALYGENANSNSILQAPSLPHSLHFHPPPNINDINQDASHHRHPHQLQRPCESLSLSNSSDFDTSSSDDNEEDVSVEKGKKVRRGKRGWKIKIKEFIDSQMRKLADRQEAWLEKMMKALEEKERERELREEEWKQQEMARIEREHKFWEKEKAWIEARDATFMDALQKLTGRDLKFVPSPNELLAAAEIQTHQSDGLTKWSKDFDNFKKRKDNSRWCHYPSGSDEVMYNQGGSNCEIIKEQGPESMTRSVQMNNGSSSPSNSNAGNAMQESCFRFMMVEGDNLWESYGMKLTKGDQNQ